MKCITGKVWKYGDNINTDVIFPGRYTYTLMSEEEMGKHALEDMDTIFNKSDVRGNIIVGGWNWGCGSAREQAVKCLKARGVGALIAKGISRIYYRNSLNEGLPIIICPQAVDAINSGEEITINFETNAIITGGVQFSFPPYPEYVLGLVSCGGLIPYVREKLRKEGLF
jgi:3-isopropylmalate/(R)-2-methylmalate dehydratase small subunit